MSVELFRACSRRASIVSFCSSYHVSLRTVIAHTGHSIRYFLLFSCPRCPRRPFYLLGLPHGQMRALYLRSQTSIHWLCNICHLVSARLFGVWLLDASKTDVSFTRGKKRWQRQPLPLQRRNDSVEFNGSKQIAGLCTAWLD